MGKTRLSARCCFFFVAEVRVKADVFCLLLLGCQFETDAHPTFCAFGEAFAGIEIGEVRNSMLVMMYPICAGLGNRRPGLQCVPEHSYSADPWGRGSLQHAGLKLFYSSGIPVLGQTSQNELTSLHDLNGSSCVFNG